MNKEKQARAIARIAERRLRGEDLRSMDDLYSNAITKRPEHCDWDMVFVLARLGYDIESTSDGANRVFNNAVKWAAHGYQVDFLKSIMAIGYPAERIRMYAEESLKHEPSTKGGSDKTIAWLDSLEDK